MSKPRRITELQLTTNPSISDLIALAREGSNSRATLGTILNSEFPSTLGKTTINGDLNVNGDINVSTIISASVLYKSGSTLHGNSADDTHIFTGSVYISGQTELGGDIYPQTPQGATLGTPEKPFKELYLQSGSISIESDIIGQPSAVISNRNNNLEISIGGMKLIQPDASFVAPTGSFSYLSSSFNHIGTANRLGDTITTGSLKVSGSTIMFGDNTMTGKTSLTGSVNISGSTNLVGNTTLQNELIVNNHTQFNHGGFDSTVTQTATAGVSGSITFNNTNNLKNVSLVSNSKITVAKGGVYIIQFSAQIDADDGAGTIYIWFKKNGTSIPNSATKVELSNNDASVMTVNILDTANDNDYYELAYQNSNGNLKLKAVPAAGNIPSIPSVIVTITQVG